MRIKHDPRGTSSNRFSLWLCKRFKAVTYLGEYYKSDTGEAGGKHWRLTHLRLRAQPCWEQHTEHIPGEPILQRWEAAEQQSSHGTVTQSKEASSYGMQDHQEGLKRLNYAPSTYVEESILHFRPTILCYSLIRMSAQTNIHVSTAQY